MFNNEEGNIISNLTQNSLSSVKAPLLLPCLVIKSVQEAKQLNKHPGPSMKHVKWFQMVAFQHIIDLKFDFGGFLFQERSLLSIAILS